MCSVYDCTCVEVQKHGLLIKKILPYFHLDERVNRNVMYCLAIHYSWSKLSEIWQLYKFVEIKQLYKFVEERIYQFGQGRNPWRGAELTWGRMGGIEER